MTNTQGQVPEALRLADFLQGAFALDWTGEAAAELRRLHSENERLAALAAGQAVAPAEPTPDELRAIASEARSSSGSASDDCGSAMYVLYGWRAAISKVAPPAMDGGADVARMDWIAVHGSFGVDSATGEVGGNGQKRLAATRKNIDAAIRAQKEQS